MKERRHHSTTYKLKTFLKHGMMRNSMNSSVNTENYPLSKWKWITKATPRVSGSSASKNQMTLRSASKKPTNTNWTTERNCK